MSKQRNLIKKKPAFNKHGLSRTIFQETKLAVRKRCGFGCVICGCGIYEYEHFSPEFKDAKIHDPNGITLLCPTHHARKTKGILSRETIERFNNRPKALQQGFVDGEFDLFSHNPIITIGNMRFEKTPVLIQIGDEPILSIASSQDGEEPYYLSAKLRNIDGEVIMEIDKNEWKSTVNQWDCKSVGDRIEIRNAPRDIELIIKHIPPHEIRIERLSMLHRGYRIEAHESKGIKVIGPNGWLLELNDTEVENWEVGLMLHMNNTAHLGYYGREGGGIIRSKQMHFDPDPSRQE
jgi:hypothetical protein